MKKLVMMAVALLAVATVLRAEDAAPAAAAEEAGCPFSFATTLDFYSAYVWRGNVINDEPVWQPGATISYSAGDYGTLSVNVWQNWNVTDNLDHKQFGGLDESDYTVSYAVDVGPCSLEVGHIWYTFPRANGPDYAHSTEEVYGGIAYNNDYVTPFLKIYGDYNMADGLYGMGGLRKSVSLTERLSLGGEVSVGAASDDYMTYYFGTPDAGWTDANLSLSLSYALTDHVTVGAKLAWMSVLDDDARSAIDDTDLYFGKTDTLWGGLNLAASF